MGKLAYTVISCRVVTLRWGVFCVQKRLANKLHSTSSLLSPMFFNSWDSEDLERRKQNALHLSGFHSEIKVSAYYTH